MLEYVLLSVWIPIVLEIFFTEVVKKQTQSVKASPLELF